MKLLSILTLLIYANVLFLTTERYADCHWVDLQRTNKFFSLKAQNSAAHATKFFSESLPDDGYALPPLELSVFQADDIIIELPVRKLITANFFLSFSARAPPAFIA